MRVDVLVCDISQEDKLSLGAIEFDSNGRHPGILDRNIHSWSARGMALLKLPIPLYVLNV